MAEWKDASNLLIQVTYKESETGELYEIRRYLKDWLEEDDGGSIGYESGNAEIGQELFGDPDTGWNWQPIKTEVVVE